MERAKPALVEEILQKRQEQARIDHAVAEASRELPAFRTFLHETLLKHIDPLPSDLPREELNQLSDQDRTARILSEVTSYEGVVLNACIPIEDEDPIHVRISCTQYPKRHSKHFSGRPAEYIVHIGEVEENLTVKGDSVVVESTRRKHTERHGFSHDVPEWSRAATIEDLQKYRNILEYMEPLDTSYSYHIPAHKRLK